MSWAWEPCVWPGFSKGKGLHCWVLLQLQTENLGFGSSQTWFSSSASRGTPRRIATLKVKKGSVDPWKQGSGALRKWRYRPEGCPEELYEVGCIFFMGSLFCALLCAWCCFAQWDSHSFALICAFLGPTAFRTTCFEQWHSHSFALICAFLGSTAFRTTTLGKFRGAARGVETCKSASLFQHVRLMWGELCGKSVHGWFSLLRALEDWPSGKTGQKTAETQPENQPKHPRSNSFGCFSCFLGCSLSTFPRR